MESKTTTITLDDGATTALERWGTTGPAILCIHGMTSSRKAWLRFARAYADQFRVFAYDQRGHGDSANVAGPMTLDRAVSDCENIAAETSPDYILGHSWGGAVAIRAGKTVARARAVIAIDPMLVQAPTEWYAEFLEDLAAQLSIAHETRETHLRNDYSDWNEQDIVGKVHALQAMTTAPIAALRDENKPASWDLRTDIVTYKKPLLLMLANPEESIIPTNVTKQLQARHSPDVTITTFPTEGHNLHRTNFEAFSEALDTFLCEH